MLLEQLDKQLFLLINSANSPFWDKLMYAISGKMIWIPLYLGILVYIWFRNKKKFPIIVLFIALAAVFADQSSVHFFKNVFHRLRPCHDPELSGLVHLVKGECGGLYGFVSSHASNSFNVALVSLMFIKKKWFTFGILCWAAVIGYSRIYLGVHFPGDVICSALLGSFTGWFFYRLYDYTDKRFLKETVKILPDDENK